MNRKDAADRLIAAPPERVYAALIDPEAWLEWLPPGGMTATIERFDARPGGSYRMVLRYRESSVSSGKTTSDTDVVEGRFVDIVPGVRVAQAVDFVSDDPAYAGTMTMRWELTGVGEGTPRRDRGRRRSERCIGGGSRRRHGLVARKAC